MEKFALNWAEMRSSLKVGRILGKNICDLYTGLFTTNDVKAITLLILNETEFFNFYKTDPHCQFLLALLFFTSSRNEHL